MHRLSISIAVTALLGGALLAGASPGTAHSAVRGSGAAPAKGVKLIKVSKDPYSGDNAQHATEAEPDTFHHGNTIVSAFQVGRYSDGGSDNTGWATSTDGGATWQHGFLPGITTVAGGTWARVSDPAVAYDAKHDLWMISGLVLDGNVNGRGVVVSTSSDGIHWNAPVLAVGNDNNDYDKDWIACDSSSSSPHEGNCYVEVDIDSAGDEVIMTTSTDGGKTWGSPKQPQGGAFGLGGQPLVQPDGTVVVPYSEDFSAQGAFTSSNGGSSWTAPVTIANISDHQSRRVAGLSAQPGPILAAGYQNLEQRIRFRPVRRPCGHHSSGRTGPAWRDACHHRHFWHGVFRSDQTPARIGHPRSAGCESARGASSCAGTRFPAAGDWLRGGHDPRHARRPRALLHRLSGHAERSCRSRRRDVDHAGCRSGRRMDPGSARSRGRPYDPAARRIMREELVYGRFQK